MAEIDDALGGAFTAITDDLPEVSLGFCGSRRHMMERLFVGVAAPLQNVGDLLALPVINQDAMAAFLVREDPVIDIPQVQRALVDVLVAQRGALADRFEGYRTSQTQLVDTLAGHPTREPDSKPFLERADLAKSSAQRARRQLEDRGQIIDDERVGGRLQDPSFERYLLVGRPLELGEPLDPDTVAPVCAGRARDRRWPLIRAGASSSGA